MIPVTVALVVAVVVLWGRSWFVETELRWQRQGVHRHLELADGTITYVRTDGWTGANYLPVDSSPDLSYGRAPDWYSVSQIGQSHHYLRLHWTITLAALVSMSVASIYIVWEFLCRRGFGRTCSGRAEQLGKHIL